MKIKNAPARVIGWISENKLLAIFTIVTLIYVIIGISTVLMVISSGVPMGDDYVAIRTYSTDITSWINETINSLLNTSRYTQSLSASISYGVLGERIATALPGFVFVWFFILMFLYLDLLLKHLDLSVDKWKTILLSAISTSMIVLWGYPSEQWNVSLFYQSFFFSSALVTYTLSTLSLATLLLFYIKNASKIKRNKTRYLIMFSILLFIICLWNEPLPTTVAVLSFLGIVFLALKRHKNSLVSTYLSISFLISSLSLLLMYFSPARLSRSEFVNSDGGGNLIFDTISKTVSFIDQYISQLDIAVLLIASILLFSYLPALLPAKKSKTLRAKLISIGPLILVSGFISLLLSIALLIIGYGSDASVITRPLTLTHILLSVGSILTISSALYWIYTLVKNKKFIFRGALLAMGIVIGVFFYNNYLQRNLDIIITTASYSDAWHEQDRMLKEAAITNPEKTIYLPPENAGIGDGFSLSCDPETSKYTIWLNQGLQIYYGINKVCSASDL